MSTVQVNPQGKTALVTGANRGIGKAIAIELIEQGATVYAGARTLSSLDELKAQFGDKLIPLQLDVTDQKSIDTAAAQITDLDILINNAGVLSFGQIFANNASDTLKHHLDVNVTGVIHLSNALVNHIKKDSPTAIVNVSSLAGLANMPMIGTYSVSKAAVHSINQGMRAELTKNNTLVMGVYPGPIDTEMAASLEMDKDSPENVAKNIVEGLINGTEDMFPDAMSQQAGPFYATNPKAVEQQFAEFA